MLHSNTSWCLTLTDLFPEENYPSFLQSICNITDVFALKTYLKCYFGLPDSLPTPIWFPTELMTCREERVFRAR